jgi:hypothetical protein
MSDFPRIRTVSLLSASYKVYFTAFTSFIRLLFHFLTSSLSSTDILGRGIAAYEHGTFLQVRASARSWGTVVGC